MSEIVLEFKNVSVHYGVIEAIRDVSFQVQKGEILTHLRLRGEGDFNAYKGAESVMGNDEDGSLLKEIKASETETWYTIKARGKKGYVIVNPFPNCDKANYLKNEL